jgi:DNA (cytosine-5)-methyltransferase 1
LKKTGFHVVWANEYDSTIWDTFEVTISQKQNSIRRSIVLMYQTQMCQQLMELVGGPPCQSWSEAGAGRGINDKTRSITFYDYVRTTERINSQSFSLAENVAWNTYIRNMQMLLMHIIKSI